MRFMLIGLLVLGLGTAHFAQDAPVEAVDAGARPAPKLGIQIIDGQLYVAGVEEDGLADVAGFRKGDILLSWQGNKLGAFGGLRTALSTVEPKSSAIVTVRRSGEETALRLRFGPKKKIRLGLSLFEGISVSGVRAGSVAQAAGLKSGDFLVSFGPVEPVSVEAVGEYLRKGLRTGGEVPISVVRAGEPLDMIAKFPRPASSRLPSVSEKRGGGIRFGSPDRNRAPRPKNSMRRSPRPPAPGQTRFGELREMVGPLVLQVEEHKALLKDLEEAAAILRKHSDNPRIQGALERVDRSLRRVQDWKKRFSWAQRGYEFFGDPKNPNTILEGLRGDLGPKSIERILEVVGEGKGRREFEKIMKKEFPELIFEFVEDHLDISKEELLERLESKSDDDDDEEDDDDDDDEEKGGRRR